MTPIVKRILSVITFLVLLAGAYLYSAWNQRKHFIEGSMGTLSLLYTADDLARMEPEFHPELIWLRRFKDGSWAAAQGLYRPQTDRGFTVALIYTGGGNFWLSERPFGSFKSMGAQLDAIQAGTALEFAEGAGKLGFEKYRSNIF